MLMAFKLMLNKIEIANLSVAPTTNNKSTIWRMNNDAAFHDSDVVHTLNSPMVNQCLPTFPRRVLVMHKHCALDSFGNVYCISTAV